MEKETRRKQKNKRTNPRDYEKNKGIEKNIRDQADNF